MTYDHILEFENGVKGGFVDLPDVLVRDLDSARERLDDTERRLQRGFGHERFAGAWEFYRDTLHDILAYFIPDDTMPAGIAAQRARLFEVNSAYSDALDHFEFCREIGAGARQVLDARCHLYIATRERDAYCKKLWQEISWARARKQGRVRRDTSPMVETGRTVLVDGVLVPVVKRIDR